MNSANPAVNRGLLFLQEALDREEWRTGERLPPLSRLAKSSMISRNSMWKAVQLAKEKHLISATRGGYITAGSPPGKQKAETGQRQPRHDRGSKWMTKRQLMEQDIANGAFGHFGRLPTFKELSSRYGVCFRTMQKIVRAMETDGVIRSEKTGYVLPAARTRLFGRRIIFITSKGYFLRGSALNSGQNRIVNIFENECMRMGFHLDIREIDFYDVMGSGRAAAKLVNNESILGFIFDIWWYEGAGLRQAHIDVLARLAAFRKPVAILDEVGEFRLPPQFIPNPLIQTYRIEGKRAGERMARHLLGLGHRCTTYISLFHHSDWSRDRFEGVREQFIKAGHGDAAVHLITENFTLVLEYVLAASGIDNDSMRKIIAIGRTPAQARDLEERWLACLEKKPDQITGDLATDSELRSLLTVLSTLIRQGMAGDFIEKISDAVLGTSQSRLFLICTRPLFEKALLCKDATAWICANDITALSALVFLRERGIQVPRDISVVGFDNTPVDALEKRLTTFDFNAMGFIDRMLNFILRPPRPRGPYRHATIEVEGIVMERDTTARAGRGIREPG
jgi:DNA-binding transcriptional regulator YhcF (GntR family)